MNRLAWSKSAPTEAGWWWHRIHPNYTPEIVRVGDPETNDIRTVWKLDGKTRHDYMTGGRQEWAGPIPYPAQAVAP